MNTLSNTYMKGSYFDVTVWELEEIKCNFRNIKVEIYSCIVIGIILLVVWLQILIFKEANLC